MKAVVYQEPYKVTVERMPDPKIEAPNDAVVRLTTTIVSHEIPLEGAPEAYDKFARRVDGYTKVLIKPGMAA